MSTLALLDEFYKNSPIIAALPAVFVFAISLVRAHKEASRAVGLAVAAYISFFALPYSLKILLSDIPEVESLCKVYTKEVFVGAFAILITWACSYFSIFKKAIAGDQSKNPE